MYGTVQKKSHGPVEISRQERHQILKLHRNPSEIIVLLPNPGPFYRSAKTAAGRPGLWRWPAATSLVPTARHPAGHPARAYYVVGVRADSDPRRRRPPHRAAGAGYFAAHTGEARLYLVVLRKWPDDGDGDRAHDCWHVVGWPSSPGGAAAEPRAVLVKAPFPCQQMFSSDVYCSARWCCVVQ
jgi:hypothetical protein